MGWQVRNANLVGETQENLNTIRIWKNYEEETEEKSHHLQGLLGATFHFAEGAEKKNRSCKCFGFISVPVGRRFRMGSVCNYSNVMVVSLHISSLKKKKKSSF